MAMIPVKRLRGGELVRWETSIGVVRVEYDHGIVPAKVLVRSTEVKSLLLGFKRRWKNWEELSTPIHELPMDQEIEPMALHA